ncbi:MAG: hypothetical protein ACI8RD_011700, partial [Bacillariaceae sp.]
DKHENNMTAPYVITQSNMTKKKLFIVLSLSIVVYQLFPLSVFTLSKLRNIR